MQMKELTPLIEDTIRLCTNRSEVVLDSGIMISPGVIISSFLDMLVSNRAVHYIPSMIEEESIITAVTEMESLHSDWIDLFATDQDQESALETTSRQHSVETSSKREQYDDLSVWEGATRDEVFILHERRKVVPLYHAVSTKHITAGNLDFKNANTRFLAGFPGSD